MSDYDMSSVLEIKGNGKFMRVSGILLFNY